MKLLTTFLLVIVAPSVAFVASACSRSSMLERCKSVACILTFYMIYLAACASIMSPDLLPYILPIFGKINANTLSLLINLTGGATLITWVVYAAANRNVD